MVRKYIQPVLHKMRVVLRDGSSIMMSSALKREAPVVTQIVSSQPFQYLLAWNSTSSPPVPNKTLEIGVNNSHVVIQACNARSQATVLPMRTHFGGLDALSLRPQCLCPLGVLLRLMISSTTLHCHSLPIHSASGF
jgi:hypothetical protein